MKIPKVLSDILFAIFMILFGIHFLIGIGALDFTIGVLAIIIGVLKFVGR
jgi:hypothetical protein